MQRSFFKKIFSKETYIKEPVKPQTNISITQDYPGIHLVFNDFR
jgi:hypothetical protein